MNASEFRIGNIVDFYGTNVTIQAIDFSTGFAISKGKPIPLSEEWLLKAGFKKDKYRMSDLVYFENGDITIDLNPDGIFKLHIGTVFIKNIHLVHKLQNFYFEYEGSELVFSTEPQHGDSMGIATFAGVFAANNR